MAYDIVDDGININLKHLVLEGLIFMLPVS